MQHCKSIVTMVFEYYFFNQLLEMMSVLQGVEGLTKELYFQEEDLQNFRLNVYTVYLHYNVLSG